MNRMNEFMMLQQLFQSSGGVSGWCYAVYLAGMFAVLLWRKENIVSWGLFRASYLLFAAALVLPAVVNPVLTMSMGVVRPGAAMRGSEANMLLSILGMGLGPALFAGAVICGLGSMMPPRVYNVPPAGPPPKHPLD